ncbi:MAG: 50S ribosomal protein L15 [Phycisphaerales bacterium]|nr:50S ribosomal protein L15 [Phycisphaerales bacterium]
MMIHEITEKAGAYKARKRLGRGPGSGTGKTAGRGHKGAYARSGSSRRVTSEGGQMPYFRRIPKRGFTNAQFSTEFWIVNLGDILGHADFKKGGEVNAERLVKAGLIRDTKRPLKVLGDVGEAKEIKAKITLEAHRVSKKARTLIEAAGGSVKEFGTRRDKVRGVDRNSDDKTPKNLTKKLRRTSSKAKPAKAKAEAGSEE